MKKLLMFMVICAVIGAWVAGCKAQPGAEHPSGKSEHPASEHPR